MDFKEIEFWRGYQKCSLSRQWWWFYGCITAVKTHQIVHFKWMWFIVRKSILNLLDKKKVFIFLIERILGNGKVQLAAVLLNCNVGKGHQKRNVEIVGPGIRSSQRLVRVLDEPDSVLNAYLVTWKQGC